MKKFMAVFTGSETSMSKWHDMDEKTRKAREQEGMQAWGKWVEKNKAAILDMGSPLGKTKKINESGISDFKNSLTAWTVVRAESHEEAAKLFTGHPHFTIFPGDSVEVMECLEIPNK